MSEYIVSARKYRPDNFGTLIGQDNIARTLKNSILRGQLAHAYLFCGPRGVGKTTTARIFAKMINCSNPGEDMEPCGECESCRSFAEGRSYCIHELDAASNNGVEDIKALIDQVRVVPQVGRYSVFIIDEVHMLSQAAFNAFLKTLEEPPAHAIFILATTEKHKILPTILSRCQTYDFNRISVPDIVRNLRDIAQRESITIDDESLHIIAQKADGAMRDALTIFDQTVAFCGSDVRRDDVLRNLNVLDHEHCFALVDNFLSGDYPAALLKFDEILSKGFNALHFVSALSSHLRDLVVSKSAALDALLELPDSLKKQYKEQAERCPLKFLYDALTITTQCESGYKASINPRLHIEFTLMKLSFLMKAPAPAVVPASQAQPVPAPVQPVPPAETPAQQAPSPAPAAQPTPSPAPSQAPAAPANMETAGEPVVRRRRNAAAGPSMSIKSMLGGNTGSDAKEEEKRSDTPEEAEIKDKWKECAALYEAKPRLANAIRSSELKVEDEDGNLKVTFIVTSEAQVRWLRDYALGNLQRKLQELLKWDKLRLDVEAGAVEPSEKVAYTPEEKLQDMVQDNPAVTGFIQGLEARIK